MPAHPAGPRHAEVLHEAVPPLMPDDVNALGAGDLAGRAAPRRTTARSASAVVDLRDLAGSTARRPTSWTRPTSGHACGPGAPPSARRRRLLRRQGVPDRTRSPAGWHEEGLGLDVCTGASSPSPCAPASQPSRIAFHGNNKSVAEIERAIAAGVGPDRRRLLRGDRPACRPHRGVERRGSGCWSASRSGVEAHTHEFIATAHEDQKFGFSLASRRRRGGRRAGARGCGARARRDPQPHRLADLRHLGLRGERAPRASACWHEVRDEHGVELPEIDLGGGLGIAYVPGDDPMSPAEIAQRLRDIVERECARTRARRAAAVRRAGARDRRSAGPHRSTRSARSSRSSSTVACDARTSPSTEA